MEPPVEIKASDKDPDIIHCPQCETRNPVASDICYVCGASLHRPPPSRKNARWLLVAFVIICAAGIFFLFEHQKEAPRQTPPPVVSPSSVAPRQEKPPAATASDKAPVIPLEEETEVEKEFQLPTGTVTIKDITGRVLAEMTVPLISGNWVALPRRFCLGGYEWQIKLERDVRRRIVEGIIGDNDLVGVWRVENQPAGGEPELRPWSFRLPTSWLPLSASELPINFTVRDYREQDHFLLADLPAIFDEAGVFIQENQVVGWTFGTLVEGGFLWAGDEGKSLSSRIRVDDFYRITFGNGREEEFTLALAMNEDYSELEQLGALVNGFRFDRRLTDEETPAHLQTPAVVRQMRQLIERLQQGNLETEVGELFDARVLIRAGDALLLKDVVNIVVQSIGFEGGITLIEDVLAEVNLSSDRKMQDLMQFYAGLYRDWIDILATNGEIQRAWRAWQAGKESLPADPEIHLLGVILALAEEDWAEADQLLTMREYPSHLRDRVENLRNRISELKGQEGKIVIQFTPGTQQIPVTALLNGSLQQDFIIDTGASMSTIPFATARQLGLSIDSQTPIRKIYTAGGVLEAPEVVISSITVQGWESRSINALILDIPDQGAWGLLGLNYLRRFRMDLQTDNGLLVLEPR